MRKVSNLVVGLLAAGVCILITYLTLDASMFNIFFNLGFLAVMVMIILGGLFFGFRRMGQTRRGLDRASDRLQNLASSGGAMSTITSQGSTLFSVPYLDEKYQEYLRYLHKTNSPTDIGDYIGEYEINNYTHRRLVEMIPDILTSLGILGTFYVDPYKLMTDAALYESLRYGTPAPEFAAAGAYAEQVPVPPFAAEDGFAQENAEA